MGVVTEVRHDVSGKAATRTITMIATAASGDSDPVYVEDE